MPSEKLRTIEHRYRRRLLVELLDRSRENGLTIREVARTVGNDPEAVHAELHHRHLPCLEDRGYIEWDKDTHEIAKGPKFDDIGPLLELISDHRDELPARWF